MNKLFVLFFTLLFTTISTNANEIDYDFSDTTCIPIKLGITKEISTKDSIIEGQTIYFKSLYSVYHNKQKILSRGDIIPAKIETLVTSGMNGFPAEIIVDDFEIPNIDNKKLKSTYTKKGQNRCYFVFPLKWLLTPLPPTGSLTNFIKGGHAKIKTSDVVTVYYYPNW